MLKASDMTLQDCFENHRGKVTDKWSSYLSTYDRIFHSFKEKPINLLEIGVQNGGSLEVWADYFPNSKNIIGCDINPNCKNLRYENNKINLLVGDANSSEIRSAINGITESFDIVLEDGSHFSGDIVRAFAYFFPRLNAGGIFIAEDLHCSYWQQYDGGLFDPLSSMEFFKKLADILNFEHWGVPNNRQSLLSEFFKKYDCVIEEEFLSQISSIEFANSLCIIHRSEAASSLGTRCVSGTEEKVLIGFIEKNGERYELANYLTQYSNPLSQLDIYLQNLNLKSLLLEAQAKLHIFSRKLSIKDGLLHQSMIEVEQYRTQIDGLIQSSSWRLTKPLRSIKSWVNGIKSIFSINSFINKNKISIDGDTCHAIQFNAQVQRDDYVLWVQRYGHITEQDRDLYHRKIADFGVKPLVSILMPVFNPNIAYLKRAIQCVLDQIYENWELCIADDFSSDLKVREYLSSLDGLNGRIKVIYRDSNGHISAATNSALSISTGDWISFMDQDDELTSDALFWTVKSINENQLLKIIYSDEDKITSSGIRHDPFFKPDFNLDLLLSQNFICHFISYRRDLIHELGGLRIGFEGAQDHDLLLRALQFVDVNQIFHIPKILYHWRSHSSSTASGVQAKSYAVDAGQCAINDYLRRVGAEGFCESVEDGYRVHYALPRKTPLVSLIIPTRDGLHLLKQCIESITNKTNYDNYEIIIVDNNSSDRETLNYLATINQSSKIKVLRDNGVFNYSALNNSAVKVAKGEFILLMNNDIEVLNSDWLSEMVSIGLQPGVGAVGAKLLYPDFRVQHAGVVLGIGGVAGHAFKYQDSDAPGKFSRARLIGGYSAVTAACLLVRKDSYLNVGGLNEDHLAIAFNDVDFCLKLVEHGLRNVWTPYALLMHHESATRGVEDTPEKQSRFNGEVDYMKKRWGHMLKADPLYNPNLTDIREDFSYSWPPRWNGA